MDLASVDLIDPDIYVEGVPHETFAFLRREAPVFWHDDPDGPGFWAVTKHSDLVAVNRDTSLYSSFLRSSLFNEFPDELLGQQRMMLVNMDPPLHTRYRRLVNKGFTPRMVAELQDKVVERTRRIMRAAAEKGEFDFVTDVAAELPLQVIAELMGVPEDDRYKVFDWSNRMIGSGDPEYAITPEDATAASLELFAYADELTARRLADPHEDLVSILAHAEIEGDRLSQLDIDLFFLLLTVAGNETTRNLISHGTLMLIENPDERRRLLEDPGLLDTAVEEMLRCASPVMHFRRTATRDTVLHGQAIAEGDKVVIWHISANRDDDVFSDPMRFDVGRSPNDHVAFGGGGAHFCLGASLARMEIRVMFTELLRAMPDLELTGPVSRLRSNFINGVKHLPVTTSGHLGPLEGP
ncbi:MAG TPA: cytochrome P450 [Acidimicrobiales bacterium]|nr:cytochrome P450 [Acidimicrobiales bacterium]